MRGVDRLKRAIISTVQRPEAGGGRHQHNIGKGLKTADVTEEQLKTLPSWKLQSQTHPPVDLHLKIQKQAHTHMGLVFWAHKYTQAVFMDPMTVPPPICLTPLATYGS